MAAAPYNTVAALYNFGVPMTGNCDVLQPTPSFMASLPTERFDVTAQLDTLCAGITALES